jgi:5-methylcytosine-specific restriction enzyme subunit McrC
VPGSLVANGFLFNLWKILEDFLVATLSEELQARHGGVPRSYPCHLDQACAVEMKPDLVWQVNGQPVAVVGAKYKPEKPSGYPYADLYHVLRTAPRCTCPADISSTPRETPTRSGTLCGTRILRSSVMHCLTLPPAKLLAQVGDIADELVTPSRLLPT